MYSSMMEFLEDNEENLRFLTEDEIPEYLRDRDMWLAEFEKIIHDYRSDKIESDEAQEKSKKVSAKYTDRWDKLINARAKLEESKFD